VCKCLLLAEGQERGSVRDDVDARAVTDPCRPVADALTFLAVQELKFTQTSKQKLYTRVLLCG